MVCKTVIVCICQYCFSCQHITVRNFATAMGSAPGVILSKRFKIGVNAIPNVSSNGMRMQENEWLIFGPVIRANVQHIRP